MRRFITMALIGTALCACGGGGGSVAPTPPVTPPTTNVLAVSVDGGPAGIGSGSIDVNLLFGSVTICVPGSTTNCQTIDHIQIDTGSSGLRIIGSVLKLSLPQQLDSSGHAVAECTPFIDGFSWGPLRTADIQVAGESAAGVAVQVIGDAAFGTIPAACSSQGTAEDTVAAFGANGILGIGPFAQDCGAGCVSTASNAVYYSCPTTSTCQSTTLPLNQQMTNPVALFATDNNGVILELPAVGPSGAATLAGSLVFGIGTQGNNMLGTATVLTVDASTGNITTQFNGTTLPASFIDSGSNGLFFADSTIPACSSSSNAPGFDCPTSTLNFSATIQGKNGASRMVSFSIANANTLLNKSPVPTALSNLGGPNSDATSFDWGLPFFFGRNVYTAIEQKNTSGGMGPFYAF